MTERNTRFVLSAAAVLALMLVLSAPVVADEDRTIDGERDIGDTVVEPGATVPVEVSFSLDESSHVDIVEGIKPAVGEVEPFILEHQEQGSQSPDFEVWNRNGGVVLFNNLPAGDYTFRYNVTIQEGAFYGQTYRFDGGIQEATDPASVRPVEVTAENAGDFLASRTLTTASTESLDGDTALTVGSEINVTADQPDNQTVEVDFDFADSTNATVDLVSDGNVITSDEVAGTAGDTITASVNLTGLVTGEYQIQTSSPEPTNVTVNSTRMAVSQYPALNVSANETVSVDLGFNAEDHTNATVRFVRDGTELYNETVAFDPVQFEGGSGVKTVSYEAESSGDVDVEIAVAPAESYGSTSVSYDTSSSVSGLTDSDSPLFWAVVLFIGGLALAMVVRDR